MWSTAPPGSVQSNGRTPSGSVHPVTAVIANGSPSGSLSLSSTPSTAVAPDVVSDVCGVVPAVMSTRSSVLPSSSKVSLTTSGASLTASTLIVLVAPALLTSPSLTMNVTVRVSCDGLFDPLA